MSEEERKEAEQKQKEIFQRAVDEWLDKRLAEFGKFSLIAIFTILFAALIHFVISWGGFKQ